MVSYCFCKQDRILGKKQGGTVYLLCDQSHDRVYKVGVTTGSVEKRVKKLQTGNGGEITVVRTFACKHPFFVEKWLHREYQEYRLEGEWFELPDGKCKQFNELCEKYDALVSLLQDNEFCPKSLKA